MKIAIMQPYFYPYLGYISLIKNTDKFIVLDDVQYIRHGWINRNRILKFGGNWQYIIVPIKKHSRECLIKDIEINNTVDWKDKILSQLVHYKKRAPYYNQTISLIENVFKNNYDDITTLNVATLNSVLEYIGIEKNIDVYSKMNLAIDEPLGPGDWSLNICKTIPNAKEYWNPPGGKGFLDKNKYKQGGIELVFQEVNLKFYNQFNKFREFEKGLSILDVMMFNSTEDITAMLDDYCLS